MIRTYMLFPWVLGTLDTEGIGEGERGNYVWLPVNARRGNPSVGGERDQGVGFSGSLRE